MTVRPLCAVSEYAASISFVLPVVSTNTSDSRGRLRTEFEASRFLWAHGVRDIPQPLREDPSNSLGLYSYLHGERVVQRGVVASDIAAAVTFIQKLHELSRSRDARSLGDASEACFSAEALLANVSRRLAIVRRVTRESTPTFKRFTAICDELAARLELLHSSIEQIPPLLKDFQTLSPSDFGFHNAIATSGGISFHDFEYFGWDDPVKLIADFMLHPGTMTPDEL